MTMMFSNSRQRAWSILTVAAVVAATSASAFSTSSVSMARAAFVATTSPRRVQCGGMTVPGLEGCLRLKQQNQQRGRSQVRLFSSGGDEDKKSATASSSSSGSATASEESASDPMMEAVVDEETRIAMEKSKRADELRAQEVFMKKSTGKHRCTNCDWEYDEAKGDVMMIGGTIQPGTAFEDLPSNWRCPVCRASKDSFVDIVEEIPGFEVNQGYGFGTNAWTSSQKNLAIFGGLGFFFLLFLSGYALS